VGPSRKIVAAVDESAEVSMAVVHGSAFGIKSLTKRLFRGAHKRNHHHGGCVDQPRSCLLPLAAVVDEYSDPLMKALLVLAHPFLGT